MKIQIQRDLCISAASCVAVAPGVFQLDAEGKALVANPKGADEAAILEAARACPVQCITITNDAGKQLYPEAGK